VLSGLNCRQVGQHALDDGVYSNSRGELAWPGVDEAGVAAPRPCRIAAVPEGSWGELVQVAGGVHVAVRETEVPHIKASADGLRGMVVEVRHGDDAFEAARERVSDRRGGGFGRVAVSPGVGMQVPADLHLRRAEGSSPADNGIGLSRRLPIGAPSWSAMSQIPWMGCSLMARRR